MNIIFLIWDFCEWTQKRGYRHTTVVLLAMTEISYQSIKNPPYNIRKLWLYSKIVYCCIVYVFMIRIHFIFSLYACT